LTQLTGTPVQIGINDVAQGRSVWGGGSADADDQVVVVAIAVAIEAQIFYGKGGTAIGCIP